METLTTRFGRVIFDEEDVIRFPTGLIGLGSCRQWVLLADRNHAAVAWLQCVDQVDVALAVVNPRRFVPDYQLRVARRELAPLDIADLGRAKVLVILGKTDRGLALNLKAPLVVNPDRRLGRQVVANGELPIRHELESERAAFKRSA
jgi:flagellar assembly factor FliW